MNGKCPKCEKLLPSATIGEIKLSAGPGHTSWKGVTYQCPSCQTILSVAIDPIAIKSDIVNDLLKKLR